MACYNIMIIVTIIVATAAVVARTLLTLSHSQRLVQTLNTLCASLAGEFNMCAGVF